MKAIFAFFAKRHLLANLLTIMILLIGVFSALRINRSVFPKIDFGMLSVTTYYPGASPEDVELNVTNKIEDELKVISGIDQLTSMSMENISIVMITLDPDASDQQKIKNEIREAVARVTDLPREVTESPRVKEENISNPPMMDLGITGDVPYAELREYARQIEKKLQEIPGVAQIYRYGWRSREIQVEVSPDKMGSTLQVASILHLAKSTSPAPDELLLTISIFMSIFYCFILVRYASTSSNVKLILFPTFWLKLWKRHYYGNVYKKGKYFTKIIDRYGKHMGKFPILIEQTGLSRNQDGNFPMRLV